HDRSTGDPLPVVFTEHRVPVFNGLFAEVEHMFRDGNSLYLGVLAGSPGCVVRLDLGTWLHQVVPGTGPGAVAGGGAMTMGNLSGGSGPDLVRFPIDGSIEVYDTSGSVLRSGREGSSPTSAVTLDYNSLLSRTELCILDRDWWVRRYDAANGAYIDKFRMPTPMTLPAKPSSMSLPKRMLRVATTTFGPSAFELFPHAGTMFPGNRVGLGTTTPVRVSFAGAGLTASHSFTDEHDWLVTKSCYGEFEAAATGMKAWPISTNSPTATLLAPMTSQLFATGEAAVITVDLPNDGPNLVFSNEAGNVRVLSGFPSNPVMQAFQAASPWTGGIGPSQSPAVVGDPGDTLLRLEALDVSSLATGELDGNPLTIDVVAGAMVPDAQGNTLFVLDVASGSAVRVASAAVGSVSGVVLGDVDLDGFTDIVVGTVEGRLRVYDRNLNPILEVDTAAMMVGARGTMWLIEGNAGQEVPSRLIFSHSEGVTAIDFAF
ncbi:MAG TPA: hypothetical protein VFX21_01090, partial [Acidimicrobiia bacterium]|nr:hypothetical protein [Acidimicrobiia bacterium]